MMTSLEVTDPGVAPESNRLSATLRIAVPAGVAARKRAVGVRRQAARQRARPLRMKRCALRGVMMVASMFENDFGSLGLRVIAEPQARTQLAKVTSR
jgi:hypothetical protein